MAINLSNLQNHLAALGAKACANTWEAGSKASLRVGTFFKRDIALFVKNEVSPEMRVSLFAALFTANASYSVLRSFALKHKPKLQLVDRALLCAASALLSMGVRFALIKKASSALFVGALSLVAVALLEIISGDGAPNPIPPKAEQTPDVHMQEQLTQTEKELAQARSRVEVLEATVEQKNSVLLKELPELRAIVLALKSGISEIQQEKHEAEKRIAQLTQQLKDKAREIELLKEASIRALDSPLPGSPPRLAARQKSGMDLEVDDIETLRLKLEASANQRAKLQSELSDTAARLVEYQDKESSLECLFEEYEKTHKQLKESLKAKALECEALDEIRLDQLVEIEGLTAELTKRTRLKEQLQEQLSHCEMNLREYENGNRLASPVKRRVAKDVRRRSQQLNFAATMDYEKEKANWEQIQEEHYEEIAELKRQMQVLDDEKKDVEVALKQQQEQKAQTNTEISALKKELEDSQAQVKRLVQVPEALLEALKLTFSASPPELPTQDRPRIPLENLTRSEAALHPSKRTSSIIPLSEDFAISEWAVVWATGIIDQFLKEGLDQAKRFQKVVAEDE